MTKNCKYLKRKMNGKLECKKTSKIISIKDCNYCKYKEYKITEKKSNPKKSNTSRNRAKLERNRFSVFTDDLQFCYLCRPLQKTAEEKHELFRGRNRLNSMQYGFVLPLCHDHHQLIQGDKEFNQYWHDRCREYWLEHYGSLDEFIKVFGKSYLP